MNILLAALGLKKDTNNAMKNRQKKLLKNLYGSSYDTEKNIITQVKSLQESVKNSISQIKDVTLGLTPSPNGNPPADADASTTKILPTGVINGTFNINDKWTSSVRSAMQDVVNKIISSQDSQIPKETLVLYTSVSFKFPELSQIIYQGITSVGKRGQEKSIINNLGEICTKQCSNLVGTCRY